MTEKPYEYRPSRGHVFNKMDEPRWYRPAKGNIFSWEIYDLQTFFICVSIGTFELQINKWSKS